MFQAARGQGLRLPPPMQPTHQHPSAEQTVRPTHTRFGMEALEDMINMGRAMSGSAAHAASQHHAHVPAAQAAAIHQQPPAQQSHPTTAASQPSHGRLSLTESKKIKHDRDGLIALETSRTVTTQQPAAAPRQLQSSGHASSSELTHQGPGLRDPGSASDPHRPSGDIMAGLELQVEDNRARVVPQALNSSASAAAATSPQYQGNNGRASLWGSPMLSHDSRSWPLHSSSPQHTPRSAPATARRFSSGRGQVSCGPAVGCLHLPSNPIDSFRISEALCTFHCMLPLTPVRQICLQKCIALLPAAACTLLGAARSLCNLGCFITPCSAGWHGFGTAYYSPHKGTL